ncbi:HNH endonuclease [Qipengyuania sp. NPDC077563]|uniref:HNH endonuclease n=1 Tax=Qipengyuania sp. NPDC077563 TaxID=3364497 RepID=UPI00384CCB61
MAWSNKSRQARGYGAKWGRARKAALARDQYLCQPCRASGRITPATEVDHILPKAKGGTDHLDNLQSICTPCHINKTTRDNGGRPRPTIGLDGWPIGGAGSES